MRQLFLAVRFLTVLPAGREKDSVSDGDLIASTYYYPVVGVLIGLLLYYFRGWSLQAWPALLSSALTVTAWLLLTAGLHMDGLMDTFDGLGVRGDRARRLSVMRDSRVGAFGVQSAVVLLLLKTAAVAALAGGAAGYALILAPVAGRTAMVALMASCSYARAESGLGKSFVEGTGLTHLLVTAALFLAVLFLTAGTAVFVLLAYQVAVFLLLRAFFLKNFGGVTGDILGAHCELQELSLLLVAAAIY
jgi:adenosylcobinamide-GDP ribazoletransferase